MTVHERQTLIEWLHVMTGTRPSFWEKFNDDKLNRLYNKTVEDHGECI